MKTAAELKPFPGAALDDLWSFDIDGEPHAAVFTVTKRGRYPAEIEIGAIINVMTSEVQFSGTWLVRARLSRDRFRCMR